MTNSSTASTLIPQVETRLDRLVALHGTVLRCIGALGGNADTTSRLVCEALRQVADDLEEIAAHDATLGSSTARRYPDSDEHLVEL